MKKIKIGLSISIGILSSLVSVFYIVQENVLFSVIFGVVAVVQFAFLLPRYVNNKM
jgi:hypothetical protein